MAIFVIDCAICGEPFVAHEPVFSTWGVWLEESDPLCGYCDAGMHWHCYVDWPHRRRFARSYFDFWVELEKTDGIWHKAWLDEYALVTVNAEPIIHSAWVHLSETGQRISVKLREWSDWILRNEEGLPPAVLESVKRAKQAMLPRVPTGEALVANIDRETKRPMLEKMRAEWQAQRKAERDRQRRIQPNNALCNRFMERAKREDVPCPLCGSDGVYELRRDEIGMSSVVCKRCGEVVPLE